MELDTLDYRRQLSPRDQLVVLRRRRLTVLGVFLAVLLAGGGAVLLSRPVYRASAKVAVPVPPAPRSQEPSGSSANPLSALLAPARPPSVAAQRDAISDPSFLAAAMATAGIPASAKGVLPTVGVDAPEGSDVVTITVTGEDPQATMRLANGIAHRHVERMEELQRTSVEEALAYVEEEQDQAARTLRAAREKLRAFRARHSLEQLAAEQEPRARWRIEAVARVSAARAALASVEAGLGKVRQRLARQPRDVSELHRQNNPQRARLEEKLGLLRLERLALLRDLQPGSPEVQAIDESIASHEVQLAAEPEWVNVRGFLPNPERAALETRLRELEMARVGHEAEYLAAVVEARRQGVKGPGIGALQVEADALVRERDRAEERYTLLSGRLQDLAIRQVAQPYAARVISAAALPTAPVWPNRPLLLVLCASLAVILAVGSGFLHEHLDDRIQTAGEVEQLAALPSLGHVPLARHSPILSLAPERSELSETYRTVRSWISFARGGSTLNRVQITSPSPGDGKTTVAANLAVSFALDGKRVVLLDTDLRHPSAHRAFNRPAAPGLAELLERDGSAAEGLVETGLPNLLLLPAGETTAEPAELLSSPAFDRLLEELDGMADVVVIDSAACLSVSDPLIVATRGAGVVLVTEPGRTRRAELLRAVELLDRAGALLLGSVMNRADASTGYFNGGCYYRPYRATSRGAGGKRYLAAGDGHAGAVFGQAEEPGAQKAAGAPS
jgi:succinoglycan biosynthesis transport protein ExoP